MRPQRLSERGRAILGRLLRAEVDPATTETGLPLKALVQDLYPDHTWAAAALGLRASWVLIQIQLLEHRGLVQPVPFQGRYALTTSGRELALEVAPYDPGGVS